MKRKRPAICIVHHNYYPEHNHIRRDAEALVSAGYDVHVVMLRQSGQSAREVINGVSVHRLPLEHRRGSWLRYLWEYALFFALAFFTLTQLHLRLRLRAVEIDNMPDLLVFSALVPKLLGVPVVLYIFDNMPELLMVTRGYSPRHPLVRLLALCERVSAVFADRVIVTQEVARQLVAQRGVSASKIVTVLNGPDERIFAPTAPSQSSPPSSAGEWRIVTHGTLLERFGIQTLIDALPAIAADVPGVRLHVIGKGEYRSALEARAQQNGVPHRVHFTDWVSAEALVDYLRQAHVGYVGMLCDNMLSNKLMEYVALGVPVILARWSVYERYFPDDSVRYFRPGDVGDLALAVTALFRDPEAARERAHRASAHYQGMRWAVQRQRYLGLYASLVGAGARSGSVARAPLAVAPHAPALPSGQARGS